MSLQPKISDPVDTALPLVDLLHRLAREMRIGASIADDCQDAIGDDDKIEIQHETAVRLQALDLLSQQLIEIGKVLDRAARDGVEGTMRGEILESICLTDLKHRLAGLNRCGERPLDPELW